MIIIINNALIQSLHLSSLLTSDTLFILFSCIIVVLLLYHYIIFYGYVSDSYIAIHPDQYAEIIVIFELCVYYRFARPPPPPEGTPAPTSF